MAVLSNPSRSELNCYCGNEKKNKCACDVKLVSFVRHELRNVFFVSQTKDAPLTSSNFVRITKELKNKDQYGQVLFSCFVRMVGYRAFLNLI